MEFRILGPVQALDGGQEIRLGGAKARALLALLLISRNRAVHEEVLTETLWGEQATAKATDNLHVLVSRIRSVLDSDRIVRDGGGYRIRVDDDELDLARFEALRAKGRPHEALELWRGSPLADFTYESWAAAEIQRLEDARLVALEERIELDLAAGSHAELAGELRALVAEHPLREDFRRQLIVALYRSGRQVEALEAYREARITLADELGLEPGPALRELEQAVLRQDPELGVPGRISPLPPPGTRRRGAIAAVAAVLVFAGATAALALLDGRDGSRGAEAAAAAPVSAAVRSPGAETARDRSTTTRIVLVRDRWRTRPVWRTSVSRAQRQPLPASSAARTRQTPRLRELTAGTHRRIVARPPTGTPAQLKRPPERFTDDFGDGVRDGAFWHEVTTGTGVTLEEASGRLEVVFAGDGVADGELDLLGARYETQCRFVGDFDVRVDFEVLDWPPRNGVLVQLNAWFNRRGAVSIGRQSQAWDEEYVTWADPTGNSRPTLDTRGSLRIRRVDDVISTHYRSGKEWLSLGAVKTREAPVIAIQAMTRDDWFADRPVRVAFDNFVLVADQPVC